MFTYLRDLLCSGFARFSIFDINIAMDLSTLLLALGIILLILALLSCFLLTGRERSFEEVKRDSPAYSLLLDDKGQAVGGKAGNKKDKKKKVKDGPNVPSESKGRTLPVKETVQHSQSSTQESRSLDTQSHSMQLETFGLSEEELNRYKAAFDMFDKDGDGCITTLEIRDAIKACGLKSSAKWVKDLIAEADADGSSTIEWPEFLKAMTGFTGQTKITTYTSTTSKGRKSGKKLSTDSQEQKLDGEFSGAASKSGNGQESAAGSSKDDSTEYHVTESTTVESSMHSEQGGAVSGGARKRNKKGKKSGFGEDEYSERVHQEASTSGSGRHQVHRDQEGGAGATIYHQMGGSAGVEADGGGAGGPGKKSGKEDYTAVQQHLGVYSSVEGGAGGGEMDRGEHIVPEEPKPSGGTEVGGPDSTPVKGSIAKDAQAVYSAGKGDLKSILEQLRMIDFNETELKQIIHILTERNTRTTVWIKAGLKPDPRIAELEKLLLDKDQKLFNDQAVLSNANDKLKHMHLELADKDNRYHQLEQNCQLAIQQNQQKDVMLQETNARLIQLQKSIQSQSNINPQHFKQLQDENKNLKDQFTRLQADNVRLQSESKVRDTQLAQSNQELKRVQDHCAGLEKLEKQHTKTMKEFADKAANSERKFAEMKALSDQLTSESSALKSQLESSQRENEQLNRRVESSVSVTNVHHVSSTPAAADTTDLEEKIRQLEEELRQLRAANQQLTSDVAESNVAKSVLEDRCQQLATDLELNDCSLQELKKTLQSLEENASHFSKADAENARLRDELSRLKTDLDARDSRIRDLTTQIDTETRDQMAELAAYRRDLQTWEREKTESAARFADLENRLSSREKENQEELQKMKVQVDQAEEDKARLMDKEVSTDELRHKELESVRNAKNSLEALVSELQGKLSDVNQKLVEQNTEVTLVRNQMDDALKRNLSLDTELREAVLGRKAAEAEKENLQMELASKGDLDSQLSKLREELESATSSGTSLQRKMSVLEQTMVGRDNSVTKLEEQIRDLQTENAKLKDHQKQQVTANGTTSSTTEVVTLSTAGVVQSAAPVDGSHVTGSNDGPISSLNSKLAAAETEIQTLKQQLSAAGVSTSVLQEMELLRSKTVRQESQLSEYKTMYAKTTFGLSDEEINRYKAAFDMFDKDGDGCITTLEIREAIKACGLKPSAKWVKDLIKEADADGSGTIEWPEFLKAMTGLTEQTKREENVTVMRSEAVSSSATPSVASSSETIQASATVAASIQLLETELSEAHSKIESLMLELENQRQLASVSDTKGESSKDLKVQLESLSKTNSRLESKLSEYRTLYAQTTYGLSEEEINRYKTAFELFDKDGDGCITKAEIEDAIQACGLKPTAQWVQDLVREADEDGSGTIEWPEFLKAMTGMTQEARKTGHGTIETTVTVTRVSDSKSSPSTSGDMSQLIAEWTAKVDAKQVEIDQLRADLKKQQDKNNELRQKNYKAVDAANQVEKIALEVAKKTTKDLEEKYQLEIDEQRKLTQALLTAAFPNVQVPSKTLTYREWLHEFEKVVQREVLTQQTHTETTVAKSLHSPSSSPDPALHAKIDSLQRSNTTLESQLEHYKAVLGQTDSMLKALETSAKVDTEQWQTKVSRLETEVEKLRRDRMSQSSESQSSNVEIQRIHTEVTILRERFEKEETERIILQKEVHRLNNELQSERQTGQDLSVQAVKLRGMVKTGQDALKQEQEHVNVLQRQLKESKNGSISDDLAELRARLSDAQKLLEKELMNNKLLNSKLNSLGVTINTDS